LAVKKKPDNRTLAQKRRKEQQDALRLKFKGIEYLRQLDNSQKQLEELRTTVRKARNTESNPNKIAETVAKADSQNRIIKTQVDLNFRRLAKVLPDLKQVDLTDGDGNNPLGSLAEALAEAVGGLRQ